MSDEAKRLTAEWKARQDGWDHEDTSGRLLEARFSRFHGLLFSVTGDGNKMGSTVYVGDALPSLLAYILKRAPEALADTVPRDDDALIEARAERDALAAKLEHIRQTLRESRPPYNMELRPDGSEEPQAAAYVEGYATAYGPVVAILDTAPSVSLALRDAEVKAQALDEAADELRNGHQADKPQDVRRGASSWLETRAAAIREEAPGG